MRRYTPLFCIAFVFCIAILAGNTYLSSYADHNSERTKKTITIYTTLPIETVAILAEEYQKAHQVQIQFIPLSEQELLQRVRDETLNLSADGVLANKEVLLQASAMGVFANYTSEQTDIVADRFKAENGAWVGVWYDPIVFCANRDYLKTLAMLPTSLESLAKLDNCRIGITDFLAADAAVNWLYTLVAEYDEQKTFALLRQIHPKVVQYSKYLATPVRMAGMGEVDISIAVQSESVRYMQEGFPLTLIYPAEGTAYMLTGVGMLKNATDKVAVAHWMQWLMEDEAQLALQKNKFFFVPTNQTTIAYKSFSGKSLTLFENYSDLTAQQKTDVLDRWVKDIRFK